ncbi:MAG: histidine phosphatase family protein [Alphaproteobacteria bacterium]|nr:histidine phosphatase family protein [Alphaproteobacteria bacterium]
MRRLLLLRHAKAEQANKDTPADAERPLAERGRRDAPRVGSVMREKGYKPDLILCSPSRRTRETLELAISELRSSAGAQFIDGLYTASAQRILALVRQLPDAAKQPLLVGHNPGLEDCALLLASRGSASPLLPTADDLEDKFPTGALAVLEFTILNWRSVTPHSGRLVDFVRPKDLPSA